MQSESFMSKCPKGNQFLSKFTTQKPDHFVIEDICIPVTPLLPQLTHYFQTKFIQQWFCFRQQCVTLDHDTLFPSFQHVVQFLRESLIFRRHITRLLEKIKTFKQSLCQTFHFIMSGICLELGFSIRERQFSK